jgi:hypothetical protein
MKNENTLKLIGRYGTIIIDEDRARAFITNPILERRYGAEHNFDLADLQTWIKRLKIEGTENGLIRFGTWE